MDVVPPGSGERGLTGPPGSEVAVCCCFLTHQLLHCLPLLPFAASCVDFGVVGKVVWWCSSLLPGLTAGMPGPLLCRNQSGSQHSQSYCSVCLECYLACCWGRMGQIDQSNLDLVAWSKMVCQPACLWAGCNNQYRRDCFFVLFALRNHYPLTDPIYEPKACPQLLGYLLS